MERNNKFGYRGIFRMIGVIVLITISIGEASAQETDANSFWNDPFNSPLLPLYLVLGSVAITIFLVGIVMIYVVKAMRVIIRQIDIENAKKLGVQLKPAPTWWERVWDRMNRTIPLDKEKDIDTGHDFDGIRELDNHLPPWWTGLFYVTVIWGVVYLVVYHVISTLPLSSDEYQEELASAKEEARIFKASQPAEVIDENSLVFTNDAAILERGKSVFTSNNCGSCHRNDGGGNNIGPNLTDAYWLHGGGIKNIYATVNKGVVEKGMPAWGKVMSAKDVRDVSFYIMSLKGSNPANAKMAQGELFKDESPADSTIVGQVIN